MPNLFDIIKSASNPPSERDLSTLREYIKDNPAQVNTNDNEGKTACHYAVTNFALLVVLALEGKAKIPANLTEDDKIKIWIEELRQEQARVFKFHGFHLHDFIRRAASINLIRNRAKFHPQEINERTYWRRNACHWAALMNRTDLIALFAQHGGDLLARDLNGNTPLELASSHETQMMIRELISSPRRALQHPGHKNEGKEKKADSEGILTKVVSGISGGMMQAILPQRTRSSSPPTEERQPHSPRRNISAYEPHPVAKSPPLSPKNPNKRSEKTATKNNVNQKTATVDTPTTAPSHASGSGRARSSSTTNRVVNDQILSRAHLQDPAVQPKVTRFLDQIPPLPVLPEAAVASNVNANGNNQAAKNKESRSTFFTSLEEGVAIFKDDELSKFKKYYKERKASPNRKLSGLGRPFIIQALLTNAGRIFIYLLEKGADLNARSHSDRSLSDYILEDNSKERIEFLKQVYSSLKLRITAKRIRSSEKELVELENTFWQKINARGINRDGKGKSEGLSEQQLQAIAEKNHQSIDITKLMYDLCLGLPSAKDPAVVDIELTRKYLMGMLLSTTPHTLITIITDLYQSLREEQKTLTFWIIKELIVLDDIHGSSDSKSFFKKIIPAFFDKVSDESTKELRRGLKKILHVKRKAAAPIVRGTSQIQALIHNYDKTNATAPSNKPKELADDLRALSRHIWGSFKLSELIGTAWTKENKLKDSPNILAQFKISNGITDYFVSRIIKQPTEKLRSAYIKFCIHTLDELINGNPADFQAAFALHSALNHLTVSRYMRVFRELHPHSANMLENADKILSPDQNFKELRIFLANSNQPIIPWLGMFTKDLTLAHENSTFKGKKEIEGKIFLDIMTFQNKLRALPEMNCQSQLGYLVVNEPELSDADFELAKAKADPNYFIRLDGLMTLPFLKQLLEVYVRSKIPLKVRSENGTISEGFQAIQAVFSWLQNYADSDIVPNLHTIEKLASTMQELPGAKGSVELCAIKFKKWLRYESGLKNKFYPELAPLNNSGSLLRP